MLPVLTRSRRLLMTSAARTRDGGDAPTGGRVLRLVDTAQAPELDLSEPTRSVSALSAAAVQRLVARGEERVRQHASLRARAALMTAAPGDDVLVSCAFIRPGQVQLSFDRVREHVEKFLRRLHGLDPSRIRALAGELGLLEVPGIVGPRGLSVVLPDRNHNFAALLALVAWLDERLERPRVSPSIRALADVLFAADAGLTVTVRVQENHASRSAAAFEAAIRGQLFFVRRDGSLARRLPARFAALEDNPVRELVSRARVKAKQKGERRVTLASRDVCVWVKGPNAPAFIEFHIASIVGPALANAGRPYAAVRDLDAQDEAIMRSALERAAADPTHPSAAVLARILVVPLALRDIDALSAAVRLDRDGTPTL